jgi:hypothetical protein
LSSAFNGNRLAFISPTKAYLFDEASSTAFVWNPREMVLSGKDIDISVIQIPGQDAFVSADDDIARVSGDRLLAPVGWSDTETYASRAVAGMLVLDTTSDEVVDFYEDERCTALESSVVTDAGDIYYFPSAAMFLDVNAADPEFPACALRIGAGETRFDENYFLNLSEITGGRIAVWGSPGEGKTAYVQVLYEERSGIEDRAMLFGAAHNDWRFWRIDVEAMTGEEVSGFPWFATSGPPAFSLSDGQIFQAALILSGDSGGLFSNVARTTTLVDLSGPAPEPAISIDGNLLFLARMR